MNAAHSALVERARRWLLGRGGCYVAMTEAWGTLTGETPDAIGFGPGGASTLIEVKVSRSDFRKDRHKPYRPLMVDGKEMIRIAGLGRKRYYLTPRGLLPVERPVKGAGSVVVHGLPEGWGLLEATPKQVRQRRVPGPLHRG